jgi:cytochrome c-type biogenesis protein CcmH/NrfG
MLEDELGGQVSAVRSADEETVRDGRAIAPAVAKRAGRTLRRGTGKLARLVLAGLLVVTATFGLLFYQQVRFERQQAVDQAERKRLELERARLELEKAETERRIGELQRDLRLAKGEAERMRLQAEIEREKEKVDVAPVGTGAASTNTAARPTGCRPGEPSCSDP